uniref:Predicted protein n=1 Tax=Hordeum vulgare subsp. vulgare TaxID=112509 RepID=F2CWR7_HORVV|nr:predicted protein [Hordeum vulgare subsp. vulgare]
MNLGIQNVVLLLKHANHFMNRKDVPWVSLILGTYYCERVPQPTRDCGSFWWKDICKVLTQFRPSRWVTINARDTVSLLFISLENW